MKKTITIGFIIFMLLTLSMMNFAFTDNKSYGNVPKVNGDIVIDGVKDKMYDDGLQIDVERKDRNPEVFATGKAFYLWNDGWVFIYAEITDSDIARINPEDQKTTPWICDNLEVFIVENSSAILP